jgi:protease-4
MAKNRDKIIIAVIVIAVLIMFGVASMVFLYALGNSDGLSLESYSFTGRVAIVDVIGVIESSENIVRQIRKYEDDNSVKALVLRIDSPGGGVAASQEIYDQLLKFKLSGKPVVISMGSVAASGGYYVACGADKIYANPGTVTGSIGVIFSFPVMKELMEKVGVEWEVVKSGELKDTGNFSRRMTVDERAMIQSVIDDTYDQFINVVADAREMDIEEVRKLSDGSIYSGRQAVELNLIDAIGSYEDAISEAGNKADLGSDPKTIKERPYKRSIFEMTTKLLGLKDQIFNAEFLWPKLEYRYIG